jgi:N,N'-diacetyllegionaminate synthase
MTHEDPNKPVPPSPIRRALRAQRIRIDRRNVGDGCSVFIIAEAGVNHDGDESKALAMIDAAAIVGADAVKFQMFTADALTTATASTADYQPGDSQRDMLRSLELSPRSFGRIARHCAARGLCFLATPFSPQDVNRLASAGAAAIKIASTDIVDTPLIKRAGQLHLPIILSTGAANESEIVETVRQLDSWGAADRLILLHCVSAYPTPLRSINLLAIRSLAAKFSTIVGLSDHTDSTVTGGLAVAAGATVLEKHFTLDRNAPGPDHAFSLTPADLTQYIDFARQANTAMGTGRLDAQTIEQNVRDVARKSVVAANDIAPGDTLTEDLLTTKRAGSGLTPDTLFSLIGKKSKIAIHHDTPVTWEMVE